MSAHWPRPTDWYCAACGYTCTMLEATRHEHREAGAYHEAGHAVMRWLQGWPIGPVCMHPDGTGLCETPTPGRRMRREDAVFIALAGPCAEVGALPEINLAASHSSDLDSARQILTPDYVQASFYPPLSQEEALRHYYDRVRDCLGREALLVEAVAEALLDAGSLPGPRPRREADANRCGQVPVL